MLYPVFLIALFIPLIVILRLRVNIVAEYVRNDVDDNISISFFTLGEALKYKFEIPLIDVGSDGVEFKFVRERGKKDTSTGEKKKKTGIIEFVQRVIHIHTIYKSDEKGICRIRCFIKKNVIFDEFRLNIREGTGDAGSTGIVNGLLWTASGLFISFLSSLFRIKSKKYKSDVKIEPNFNGEEFKVDLFCIFHTKLVHIILILAVILLKRKKQKPNIKKETGGDFSG